MAAASVLQGDYIIQGNLRPASITLPSGFVTDAGVASDAAIAASKLCHRAFLTVGQSGTAATATVPLHFAYAAGAIVQVSAGSIAIAVGAATVTVDIKKNGTTVLSSVITLDTANTARVQELGTLSVTTFAAGDLFEAVITATAGGGTLPTGLIVQLVLDENPS